jgi:hypothetical protein
MGLENLGLSGWMYIVYAHHNIFYIKMKELSFSQLVSPTLYSHQ